MPGNAMREQAITSKWIRCLVLKPTCKDKPAQPWLARRFQRSGPRLSAGAWGFGCCLCLPHTAFSLSSSIGMVIIQQVDPDNVTYYRIVDICCCTVLLSLLIYGKAGYLPRSHRPSAPEVPVHNPFCIERHNMHPVASDCHHAPENVPAWPTARLAVDGAARPLQATNARLPSSPRHWAPGDAGVVPVVPCRTTGLLISEEPLSLQSAVAATVMGHLACMALMRRNAASNPSSHPPQGHPNGKKKKRRRGVQQTGVQAGLCQQLGFAQTATRTCSYRVQTGLTDIRDPVSGCATQAAAREYLHHLQ